MEYVRVSPKEASAIRRGYFQCLAITLFLSVGIIAFSLFVGYEASAFLSPFLLNGLYFALVLGIPRSMQYREFVVQARSAPVRRGCLLIDRDLVEYVSGVKADASKIQREPK